MQLKTSVKIVDDPRGKQADLNQAFRKAGIETPDLATEKHGSESGSLEGVDAARAVQTALPQGNNATRMTVLGPASQGIPLANQPRGCRVVIHQQMVVNEIAKGVVIHEGIAPPAEPSVEPAVESAPELPPARPLSNLELLSQQLDKAKEQHDKTARVIRYLEEQIDKELAKAEAEMLAKTEAEIKVEAEAEIKTEAAGQEPPPPPAPTDLEEKDPEE